MSRILIVEDEERIASFLAKGLRAQGYVTDIAATGSDGLARALSGDADLVILDIGLPDRDGFSVLRELRQYDRRLPVVILTARDDVEDKVAGFDEGANDYVTKPFKFDELLARVRVRLREGERAPAETVMRVGDLALDLRTRRARWAEGGRAERPRVRPRRASLPASGPGAEPRADTQQRVGLRLRPGFEHRRRLYRVSAQEARARLHHERSRHGVPAGEEGSRLSRSLRSPAGVRCRATGSGG